MVNGTFEFNDGMVFLIPFGRAYILAQVGRGGDLGVFGELYEDRNDFRQEHLDTDPIFRVHFGAVSPKKFGWSSLGEYPLGGIMAESSPYYHQAIGDDRCFIVQHGMDDKEIDCNDIKHIEPLATWSHEHIIRRFEDYRDKASLGCND